MKIKFGNLFKYALSIAILIMLLIWVDLDEVVGAVANANYGLLGASLLVLTLNRVIMAGKWNMLLRVKNIRISLFEATKLYYISNYLGFFLPPSVGADLVRGYYVARQKYPLEDIISSILVERLVGMIVLFLSGIFGAIVFLNYFGSENLDVGRLLWAIIGISVALIFMFSLSFQRIVSDILLRLLERDNPATKIRKIAAKLAKLYKSYLLFGNHKGVLAVFCLLTVVELTTYIIRSWIVARALGITTPLIYFFAFVPIIILLVRLPISLHGFGIQEMGFVYFLSLVGISETVGFSIGIVDHFILIIGIMPGALFYAQSGKPTFDESAGIQDRQNLATGEGAKN
jgi:uncharacterized protein (TIRG00374 family)